MRSEIPEESVHEESCACCPATYMGVDISWIPAEVRKAGWMSSSPLADIKFDIQRSCTLLDLGCGAGLEVFIASRLTGPQGRVIGIDVTPEKLSVARKHADQVAKNLGYAETNVSFKEASLGELQLEDETIDIVTSNCAINLGEDKHRVYDEIFRVLKPGGRFVISDIFSAGELPVYLQQNEALASDRLNTAEAIGNFLWIVRKSGLRGIALLESKLLTRIDMCEFFSLTVTGYKPYPRAHEGEKYATLIGPCSRAVDEVDNTYERGKVTKISAETAAVLNLPSYRDYFFISDEPKGIKESAALSIFARPVPCVFMGDYVILFGPFVRIHDDDNQIYNTGQELEICHKTLEVLSYPLYKKLFVTMNRCQGRLDPKQSCCGPE